MDWGCGREKKNGSSDAGAGTVAAHTPQSTHTHTSAVYTVKSNRHPVSVQKCSCAEASADEQSGNSGMCRWKCITELYCTIKVSSIFSSYIFLYSNKQYRFPVKCASVLCVHAFVCVYVRPKYVSYFSIRRFVILMAYLLNHFMTTEALLPGNSSEFATILRKPCVYFMRFMNKLFGCQNQWYIFALRNGEKSTK